MRVYRLVAGGQEHGSRPGSQGLVKLGERSIMAGSKPMLRVRPVLSLLAVVAASSSAAAPSTADPRIEQLHVQGRVPVGGLSAGLAYISESVVAVVMKNGVQLLRIDPSTNSVTKQLKLGRSLDPDLNHFDYHVAGGYGSIWVAENTNDELVRIDPAMTHVIKKLNVVNPFGISLGFGSAWVPQFHPYSVERIDPRTNKVRRRYAATGPTAIAIGAGSVWVLAHRASELLRTDPRRNKVVATIPLRVTPQGAPERMTFGAGAIWVTDSASSVVRVDPQTNKQVAQILMPQVPPISYRVTAPIPHGCTVQA
jgi:hypothetical protein